MGKLFKKITRQLTDREAAHIVDKIWGYDLKLIDDDDKEMVRGHKRDIFDYVRSAVNDLFDPTAEGATTMLDDEFCVENDGEGLSLYGAMKTFEYLLKIGVLI